MSWPKNWHELVDGTACPMCVQGRVEDSTFGTRIFAGEFIDAYAGKQAAQPGYAYAVWRGRHVTDITELNDTERAGFWREIAIVADAMRAHYQPRKMNYEVLGNVVPHLHAHITARFADGDVAPGAPLPHRRDLDVPPERLADDVAALRSLLGHA